ncbi:MAG: poly(3-hydroxyalkanoate) polymerase, partial [Lapillicoccus sp.]
MGEDNVDVAAPLDSLLVEAAFSPFRRFNPGIPGLRLGLQLASRPWTVGRKAASTAGELVKVAVGSSSVAPAPKDRRFADQAWSDNPVLHRVLQAYLVTGQAATELVSDADLG